MTLKASETRSVVGILQVLLQMRAQILELFKNTDNSVQSIADLPPSMIPTELLFDISVCYEGIFQALQEYQLIKAGHMKMSNNTH